MSEEGSNSSNDAIDIVLYVFVLGPAVEWCLRSPRVNKSGPGSWRGISLAVTLLALVALGKMVWEVGVREPNHFETLGVRVDASTAEIKKAYKAVSLKYHPDKTDDPQAPAIFMRMQSAYETLKDPQSRDRYNKFGAGSSSEPEPSIMNMAIFYVMWLIMGYLLTMGKASEDARTWSFSGLLALAVIEYQTRILSYDYLSLVLPYNTVNEKIELLHRLFPPFLHGSRMISQVIFRDVNLYNKMLVEQMHIKVDELGKLVYATQKELAKHGSGVGGSAVFEPSSGACAANARDVEQSSPATIASREHAPAPISTLANAEEQAAAAAKQAAAVGAAESQHNNRLANLILFFLCYGAFKWMVDKE